MSTIDQLVNLPESRKRATATILERCVCMVLECHELGNNRKVDLKDLIAAGAGEDAAEKSTLDERAFHATKRLLDPVHLREPKRLVSKAKAYLRGVSTPTPGIFGEGAYLVPWALVEEADAALTRISAEIFVAAQRLAAKYETAVEEQRALLGKTFDEKDYVKPSDVERAFSIDWSYAQFGSPEKLTKVSRAIAAREQEKHRDRLARAFDEHVMGLRATALDVVSELEARLTPKDGKRFVVRDTALRDLNEFCALLPKRDVAEDDRLKDVMKRIAARVDGVSVDAIKDDDALRTAIVAAAAEAKAALSGLVVPAGRRGLAFGASLDAA